MQATMPSTDSEWTIHSLNIQGTFFERGCQEVVRKSNWSVLSTNYPVEFPRHNGPLIGEQSKLDIYARLNKETIRLSLLVECKKNNPDFIDWIFFPHPNNDRAKHFSGLMVNNLAVADIDWTVDTRIAPMRSLEWTITGDAWETRGNYLDYKGGKKTKTSNASIEDAAHQIALATRAVFQEEYEAAHTLMKTTIDGVKPYEHQIFIPAIFTTAKLYTCNFDPNDVNQISGEIPFSSTHLEEQPYLLYEYALPPHLQTSAKDVVSMLRSENRDFGNRMDILIVNSSKIEEFLKKLERGNA